MAAQSSFAVCLLYCGYIEQVFLERDACPLVQPSGAHRRGSAQEQVPDAPSRSTLCLTSVSLYKPKEIGW